MHPKARRLWYSVTLVLLLAFSPAGALAGPPGGADPGPGRYVPDQVLVRFQPGVAPAEAGRLIEAVGGRPVRFLPQIGLHTVALPPGVSVPEMAARFRRLPAVKYAEPNFIVQALYAPNDPGYPQQWGLPKVAAAEAWDVARDASAATVAIVDTGVDPNHPDLRAGLVPGWNYDTSSPYYNTDRTDDDHGHGTHVAGIAAAVADNGVGVAGISFNARIMPLKVLNSSGSGTSESVAYGIVWAADNGAQVINLSLGQSDYSQALEDAVNYAFDTGALIVAAAGNNGNDAPFYPAALVNAMAVSATDASDQKASWSNYGTHISVAAPGQDIYSTYWSRSAGSTYGTLSGTSMATPFVSGLAALSLAQNPGRTNAEVRAAIEQNTDDVMDPGWDVYTGYGRINARKVITGVLSGRVTDQLTGLAVAGATVELLQGGGVKAGGTTAGDGTYRIGMLPPGSYDVRVSASGYAAQTRAGVTATGGVETRNVNFALARN